MSLRAALVVLATLLSIAALTGCGLEGQAFTTTEAVPVNKPGLSDTLVTPEALAKIPENSLRGVVLRWWRGVQTRDPQVVLDSYTPEARDQLPKQFSDVLVLVVSPAAAKASIRINSLEPSGDGSARVYLTIYSSDTDAGLDGPLALPMKKVDGEWRIDDPTFLNAIVETYLKTTKAATKAATKAGQ
jgi:predicted small lipoprotein YifL